MGKPGVLLLGKLDQYVLFFKFPSCTLSLLDITALLTKLPHSAHKEWAEKVESIAEVKTPKSSSRADFLEECKSGAFDGCVAAYRTFGSFSITGMIDEEVVSVLPKSLKFICHNGMRFNICQEILRTDGE